MTLPDTRYVLYIHTCYKIVHTRCVNVARRISSIVYSCVYYMVYIWTLFTYTVIYLCISVDTLRDKRYYWLMGRMCFYVVCWINLIVFDMCYMCMVYFHVYIILIKAALHCNSQLYVFIQQMTLSYICKWTSFPLLLQLWHPYGVSLLINSS